MSTSDPLHGQRPLRRAWRKYIDQLEPYRPALHVYCRRLTGNVWDGEDLVQDTLIRVFTQLGKTNVRLEHPRAYLIRTATNLWIDRVRRSAHEEAILALEPAVPHAAEAPGNVDGEAAVKELFQRLHPQERAAFLLKDVFGLSLAETASILRTTVGAVKSALGRGRGRLEGERPHAAVDPPSRELVERFARALSEKDMVTMKALCAEQVCGELVGGAELGSFEQARKVFEHAHMELPGIGLGKEPRWTVAEYMGEPIVLGFRTLDGVEGLNETHRLEVNEERIVRVRTYCFCPETLAVIAGELGLKALPRPHRSPSIGDFFRGLLGVRPAWFRPRP
jgi:RNA polymerase sigma-70 factor, ECF subfamily